MCVYLRCLFNVLVESRFLLVQIAMLLDLTDNVSILASTSSYISKRNSSHVIKRLKILHVIWCCTAHGPRPVSSFTKKILSHKLKLAFKRSNSRRAQWLTHVVLEKPWQNLPMHSYSKWAARKAKVSGNALSIV